jgi:hypothetical protein
LDISDQNILEENFEFFKRLDSKRRKLFNHRVVIFLENHEFIGKEKLIIDDKMKILIAGTAIMLSFGFENYLYSLFDKILVYPQDFFSYSSHHQHKGETNPAMGVIAFSWEDFKEGIKIKDDNLHLGLHEFSHALHFSFLKENSNEASQFIINFSKIVTYVKYEEVKNSLLNSGYLREYAFENQYELFAVMVEHFYESPLKFRELHPELFHMMGNLLQFNRIFT